MNAKSTSTCVTTTLLIDVFSMIFAKVRAQCVFSLHMYINTYSRKRDKQVANKYTVRIILRINSQVNIPAQCDCVNVDHSGYTALSHLIGVAYIHCFFPIVCYDFQRIGQITDVQI